MQRCSTALGSVNQSVVKSFTEVKGRDWINYLSSFKEQSSTNLNLKLTKKIGVFLSLLKATDVNCKVLVMPYSNHKIKRVKTFPLIWFEYYFLVWFTCKCKLNKTTAIVLHVITHNPSHCYTLYLDNINLHYNLLDICCSKVKGAWTCHKNYHFITINPVFCIIVLIQFANAYNQDFVSVALIWHVREFCTVSLNQAAN